MELIQLEKKKQDETLDKISISLEHLHAQAHSISDELVSQSIIIKDIDNKIDTTQGKMDSAIKQVTTFLKNRPTRDWIIIATLIIILVIVLYFALA